MNSEMWAIHFRGTDNPLVHYIPQGALEVEVMHEACNRLRFPLFRVNAEGIHSVPALMAELADAMKFPDGTDSGWDALLDSMRDLSWTKASGYVLVFAKADSLIFLPEGKFSTFLSIIEVTIRDWRDERGDYGERTAPVPFHVVLSGSDSLRAALLREVKEPLCIHREDSSVEIIRTPPAISGQQAFRDAEHLVQNGTDPEVVLSFLRERGMDRRESMYAIAGLMGTSVSEAKAFVQESKIWSDLHPSRFREVARRALEAWGLDDDSPLPDKEGQK